MLEFRICTSNKDACLKGAAEKQKAFGVEFVAQAALMSLRPVRVVLGYSILAYLRAEVLRDAVRGQFSGLQALGWGGDLNWVPEQQPSLRYP